MKNTNIRPTIIILLFSTLFIFSCQLSFAKLTAPKTAVATKMTTITKARYPTVTPDNATPTPQSLPDYDQDEQPCALVWTSNPLPEAAELLKKELTTREFSDFNVLSRAYGENCINPQTNKVEYFLIMETDFQVTIQVNDLDDKKALGNLLYDLLDVFFSFPEGTFPGPQPGRLTLIYQSDGQEETISFPLPEGKKALEQNLAGEDLFNYFYLPE